jgi:hypothetical protein
MAAPSHCNGMTTRMAPLGALLLICACNDRPAESVAYDPVHLEPFTVARAKQACPNGYEVLWRKECLDNPSYNSAVVLCRWDAGLPE